MSQHPFGPQYPGIAYWGEQKAKQRTEPIIMLNGKPTTSCNCADAHALGNEAHDQPCPCLCCNPGAHCTECRSKTHKRSCSRHWRTELERVNNLTRKG